MGMVTGIFPTISHVHLIITPSQVSRPPLTLIMPRGVARKKLKSDTFCSVHDDSGEEGDPSQSTLEWVLAQSHVDEVFVPTKGRRNARRRFESDRNAATTRHITSSDFAPSDGFDVPDDEEGTDALFPASETMGWDSDDEMLHSVDVDDWSDGSKPDYVVDVDEQSDDGSDTSSEGCIRAEIPKTKQSRVSQLCCFESTLRA